MKKALCFAIVGLLCTTAFATDLTLTINPVSVDGAYPKTVEFQVLGVLSDTDNMGLGAYGFDIWAEMNGTEYDFITGGYTVDGHADIAVFDDGAGLTNPDGYDGTVVGTRLAQVGGAQNTIDNPNGPNPPYPAVPNAFEANVGHTAVILATVTVTLDGENGTDEFEIFVGNGFGTAIDASQTGPVYAVSKLGTVGGDSIVISGDVQGCAIYDLDDSGFVGTGDINLIKANYGPCTSGPCKVYDLDGSDFVGTGDINLIKANYGPCP